jgi:outer membrane protein assembly factor BamB
MPACGGSPDHAWPTANGDLAGTRAAPDSGIDAENVRSLRPRWRFQLTAKPSFSGIFASTPVADADTVYVQDLRSNVFALDRETGAVRWSHSFNARNDGPNGLAVEDGVVYGATDSDAFALRAADGRQLWQRHLTSFQEQFVNVAPVVWNGRVLISTVGYPAFGRGAVYALDAETGAIRWKLDTIKEPWPHPREAGGGGLWNPVSVDDDGRVYGGNSNPAPWGGTPERPNGASFPGPALYTDSLLVLDGRNGSLLWHDQVTPHDVRDYDFQDTPILGDDELVFGAGKAGRVIAWNRGTHRRAWETVVGLHLNDRGPLPRRRVTICPGLLGGVETQMAHADGRLFVPVVDLCAHGSATSYDDLDRVDPARGRGRLVALDASTGRRLWERRFASPVFGCATVADGVVFTSTYDGVVYALDTEDGKRLWSYRMRAGINACPALVGDLLIVGAGAPRPGGPAIVPEVVAFARS